ncbi:hypothetical protein BCR43DRAFT_489913 [Syncephalastrum racemosum]|uniref:F-box domain-containing protein n=1 Tax=Syncephalastrum racemosum TaxID=13706 RepID=A0A1X2HGB8_SYNRA|nr:hypothetical protein BCR43DRAFT_489913 [Syncephalastrum racemosum]
MHFSRLPTELLHAIFRLLPRSSLTHLCLTNRFLHEACLPVLYCHLELSFRSHIRQLMTGLQRPLLRDTIQQHTKHLTLVCRQSGSQWLVVDLQHLFRMIQHVHTLTFSDFQVLPIDNIRSLANILPTVDHLQFRYCNLESTKTPKPHHDPSSHMPLPVFQNATKLSLSWTDFGEPAMTDLLCCLPHLETVCFGANHNRTPEANDAALRILPLHCPKVRHLEVSLQQVSETTLCNTIAFYGNQLERLSVRCDGPRTLHAVATYATRVHDLVVRGNGAITLTDSRPLIRRPNGTTRNEQQRRLEVSMMETNEQEEPEEHGLLSILRQCEALRRLEIVCWMIQDVPGVIWNAIESVAQRRIATATRKRDGLHAQSLVSEARSSLAAASASASASGSTLPEHENWREGHPVFEIHPPSDRTGGVWLYYFDDNATRNQQGLRRREIGHLEKTLALDGEELSEIRKHIQTTV